MSITIEVDGVDGVLRAFAEIDVKLNYKVDLAKRNTATAVAHRAFALAPEFFGDLKASIHVEGDNAVADSDHAAPVEYGSRPHMPPMSAVAPWAIAHGVSPWAVALHIARFGTRAQPFMRPAAEAERAPYEERVAKAIREAML